MVLTFINVLERYAYPVLMGEKIKLRELMQIKNFLSHKKVYIAEETLKRYPNLKKGDYTFSGFTTESANNITYGRNSLAKEYSTDDLKFPLAPALILYHDETTTIAVVPILNKLYVSEDKDEESPPVGPDIPVPDIEPQLVVVENEEETVEDSFQGWTMFLFVKYLKMLINFFILLICGLRVQSHCNKMSKKKEIEKLKAEKALLESELLECRVELEKFKQLNETKAKVIRYMFWLSRRDFDLMRHFEFLKSFWTLFLLRAVVSCVPIVARNCIVRKFVAKG